MELAGRLRFFLAAVHDVRRCAYRSTGVEDSTRFDAPCTRLIGGTYDELVERTLRSGSNEETLESWFARGNPQLNGLAIAKTCFLLRLGVFFARFISPAALFKERIPG